MKKPEGFQLVSTDFTQFDGNNRSRVQFVTATKEGESHLDVARVEVHNHSFGRVEVAVSDKELSDMAMTVTPEGTVALFGKEFTLRELRDLVASAK